MLGHNEVFWFWGSGSPTVTKLCLAFHVTWADRVLHYEQASFLMIGNITPTCFVLFLAFESKDKRVWTCRGKGRFGASKEKSPLVASE